MAKLSKTIHKVGRGLSAFVGDGAMKRGLARLMVLSAVVCGLMRAAVYADVVFPTTGEGGDLADAGASASDVVTIKSPGTYTASTDLTFKSVVADGGGTQSSPANMVFDFTANDAKVTLKGGSSVFGLSQSGHYRTVTLKGGTWDFDGSKLRNGPGSNNTKGTGLTLTDGVVVTNVNEFLWGDHAVSGVFCTIGDGAKVHTTGNMYNQATGGGVSLNISGGGKVTVGGSFKTDNQGNVSATTGNNSVTVTGEGTCMELKGGTQYFGQLHSGNTVTIDDHARLVASAANGAIYVGYSTSSSASSNNAFIVTGGASATVKNVNVGQGTTSCRNRYIVQDGAYATNTQVTVGAGGSCRNELVVRNAAAFVANKLVCGDSGSRNNTVRVYGAGSNFFAGSPEDLFGVASDCLVELNDGATIDAPSYFRLGAKATNCTLRISGGSNLFVTNKTCSIGTNGDASLSNRIEVVDGAYAKVIRLRLQTEAGCAVVSNSTIEASEDISVGYKDNAVTVDVKENRFELHGNCPKVVATNGFTLARQSTLHLQIPSGGYADGYALIEAKTFTLSDADSRLTVDMGKHYRHLRGRGRVLVARTTNGVTLNADALAASNALLPGRCMFSKSADGKNLYLNLLRPDFSISFR